MNIYFLAVLLIVFVIIPVLLRSKIKRAFLSYKQTLVRINVARAILRINVWVSILLGLASSVVLGGMGHGGKTDWLFFALLTLGMTGFFLLISYLALMSFANKKLIAQIYIWAFCIFYIFIAFPLFPFSTLFGIFIAFGQFAWHKTQSENK